ncbi:flippase [Colwellia sp. TT2012]|uniref:flippase n=1 Tax=Colwellia sp. TT2012 TaxID=1720342 RepID=UPI00070CA91C|nr:flippase [Colwellia sp. TT2012]
MSLSINVKNSLLLISEKVIILGMSFLTSVLMARIAGPEVFGQYAYITSFTSLFIPLCAMGLNNISTKYFVKYPKHSHYVFLSALFLRSIGALICIVLGGISAYLLGIKDEQLTYILLLLVLQSFSLFYLVEFFFLAKKQVSYTLKIRLAIIVCTSTAKIFIIMNGANLFSLLFVHGFEFVAIGLSYLTLYYLQGNQVKGQISKAPSKQSVASLFHQGKWLLLSGIAAVLYLKIDQVMLASFHGTEEVAYYAAAAKLSEFWYVFPLLIANAFNPKLIQLKQQSADLYQTFLLKILSFMVASAILISLITYAVASPLINLIYGDEYQISANILSIHIFATLFIFQRAILSKWLIIESYYKFSLMSHGAGAISNILLNLLLIPTYGGIGAAWATLLSYMIASFLSLAFTRKTREFMRLMITAMIKWPKYLHSFHIINKESDR